MKRDNVLSLISIAKKAGRVASGEFQTEAAVKSGKAELVILSEEASENTKKKFRNMCEYYEVPCSVYAGKEALGAAIGCAQRSSLAILDPGFAASLRGKLEAAGVTKKDGGRAYGDNQGA